MKSANLLLLEVMILTCPQTKQHSLEVKKPSRWFTVEGYTTDIMKKVHRI